MRIVHVNLAKGWRGGERQTLLLMEGLRAAGVDSILVGRMGQPLAERARALGLHVREIRKPFMLHGRHLGMGDLVHCHTAGAALQLAAVWKRINHKPLVVTRRVTFPPGRGPLTRWKYRQADRIIAISEGVRTVLAEWGVSAATVPVIYSAVDAADQSRPESVMRVKARFPDRRIIGCVASFSESKDLPTLLRAAQRIQRSVPSATIVLLGDGELRPALEAQAHALGLDNVVFEGFQPDPHSYYRCFDAFVLTSKEEGLGTAILDAFKYGVPVVATRAGGIPEMVRDGETGLLCEIGDDVAIAAALDRLLKDPALAGRLAAQARARLDECFSLDAMVEGYLKIYNALLPHKHARS